MWWRKCAAEQGRARASFLRRGTDKCATRPRAAIARLRTDREGVAGRLAGGERSSKGASGASGSKRSVVTSADAKVRCPLTSPHLRRRRPRSCSCCPRPRRHPRCRRLAARRRLPSRLSPEALDAPARSRPGWCQRARSSSCRRRRRGRRGPCPRPRRQLPARLLLPRRARVRVGERCLLRVDAHQLPRRLVVLELADVGRGGRHLGIGAGVGEDEVVGQAALGAAGKGRGGRRG